jgi:succinate dehydrogenase / fumarate reductase flavoprotein subunit
MERIQIIGAGLAGLSAAIALAKMDLACNLISIQPSERAQSVMAEGGVNGALDTMGEGDTPQQHMYDTLKAGVYLADEEAVRGLTERAPDIIRGLSALGVPFNANYGVIQLRNFGGQKNKRTAYARSGTGKIVMTALIDEARKYEQSGLIIRYPHHDFCGLRLSEDHSCIGAAVCDTYKNMILHLSGPVILAFGGMNGIFPSMTTGTIANSADAAAKVFAQGVIFGSLEMIQYHPTTIGIPGKRCLVSEAARGEGGRLFIERNGQPWYFMEEKYPELGNLAPRDVVSREMYFALANPSCGNQAYLDLRGLSGEVWKRRLPDLREEIQHYLRLDPKKTPIPVEPGIHYFMGGIYVDPRHRANLKGLYAAGECCCQYHGANRLGGNSMLGAIYGGKVAAESLIGHIEVLRVEQAPEMPETAVQPLHARPSIVLRIRDILIESMGIIRNERILAAGLTALEAVCSANALTEQEQNRVNLAKAMIMSARLRTESRGAHYREDYPAKDDALRKMILASFGGEINLAYQN